MDDTTTIQNSPTTLSVHDAERKIVMDVRKVASHADRTIRIVDGLIASIDETGGRITQ